MRVSIEQQAAARAGDALRCTTVCFWSSWNLEAMCPGSEGGAVVLCAEVLFTAQPRRARRHRCSGRLSNKTPEASRDDGTLGRMRRRERLAAGLHTYLCPVTESIGREAAPRPRMWSFEARWNLECPKANAAGGTAWLLRHSPPSSPLLSTRQFVCQRGHGAPLL